VTADSWRGGSVPQNSRIRHGSIGQEEVSCPLYIAGFARQLPGVEKILVIDDDAKIRRHIMALLESEDYKTVEARNGREGVEMAKREKPALVLCDITMPEMNGHRVLEALRADAATSHLPFIFLTGWGEREDLRTGMNLGADDYLVKPFEPSDLITAVKARLRRRPAARPAGAATVADATPQALATALGLTPREAELLSWVVQGKTNPEIGIILGIQLTTVKKHLESIFAKLGVENRTAAVTLALEKIGQQP
jgi:DNA-binding NarL/FixJ family response regulator